MSGASLQLANYCQAIGLLSRLCKIPNLFILSSNSIIHPLYPGACVHNS